MLLAPVVLRQGAQRMVTLATATAVSCGGASGWGGYYRTATARQLYAAPPRR